LRRPHPRLAAASSLNNAPLHAATSRWRYPRPPYYDGIPGRKPAHSAVRLAATARPRHRRLKAGNPRRHPCHNARIPLAPSCAITGAKPPPGRKRCRNLNPKPRRRV